jgi:hypothetical protein
VLECSHILLFTRIGRVDVVFGDLEMSKRGLNVATIVGGGGGGERERVRG